MGFLKRCGGSNVCHFSKIIQRACFSVLAYNGLLEQDVCIIRQFKPPILAKNRRIRFLGVYSSRDLTSVTSSSNEDRRINPFNVSIPVLEQKNLADLSRDVKNALFQKESEKLREYTDYSFAEGGKLIRPTVVLLMAGCCRSLLDINNNKNTYKSTDTNNNTHNFMENREINRQKCLNNAEIIVSQKKVAVVSEMIHTASLVHDDVIDQATHRRGRPTLCSIAGKRAAIKVGNYILSKATQLLTTTGDDDVIEMLSQVIYDLVKGEVMQLGSRATEDERFTHYMSKTFKKTASLFALSCKAVAQLANCDESILNCAFEYGKNLGLAFQLIDDTLDFVVQNEEIGKPTFVDLKLGLATAPVLFACRQHPELNDLILRRFSKPGDVELAYSLILESDGIMHTKQLAHQYSRNALEALRPFPDTPYKEALKSIASAQSSRDR